MKKKLTQMVKKISTILTLLGICIVFFNSCKKDEILQDPNDSKYLVLGIKIFKTNGDSVKSLITGLPTSAKAASVDLIATVADDGNPGKRFKVSFIYPASINPTSVTVSGGSATDSLDFSTSKTFTIKFSDAVTTTVNLTISEQAAADPVLNSFAIPNAERILIDEDNAVISVRMPQGTALTALTPTTTISPNTAEILTNGALDFTNSQSFRIKNGSRTKTYTVSVTDYGFTRVTKFADFSVSGNNRPAIFTTPESSVAIDPTGQFVFVAVNSKIYKYDLNTPAAAPTELNLTLTGGATAPAKVLQIAGTYLLACNNPWGGGNLQVAGWSLANMATPVLIANVTLPAAAIVQNMQIKLDATSATAYFVNREPVRRSPKVNPTVNTINIPFANLLSGTGLPITTFTSTTEMANYASSGYSDAPNMDIIPILNNTTDFLYNGWGGRFMIMGSDYNASTIKVISGALLGTYVQGIKAFEYNRGKYAMFAITPGSGADNAANPLHSSFFMWDFSKKGYRNSLVDIETERTATPVSYATWNSIQKFRKPLGTKGNGSGDWYCQTGYAIIGAGATQKLRVVALSVNNGFVVYDLD